MQIVVKTGTTCNFSCTYCSEGDEQAIQLKQSVFRKLVDELPVLMEKKQDKVINILWHGGEPLLWGKDNFDQAMQYAEEKLKSYSLEFTLQTNGYLLDAAFIELFQHHQVRVGVSLDGYQELHDKNRRTKDGKPTFDVVWQNVQKIRQAGLGGSILMVLDAAEPIDVDRLYDFIERNTLPCKINPLIPCGRAENRKDAEGIYENYVQLMRQLYEKAIMSKKNIVIDPLDKIMDAIVSGQPVRECSYSGECSQGIFCLYTDGSIGFCGRDSEKQKFSYGSINETPLIELYDSVKAQCIRARDIYLSQHACKDCSVWNLCHGGCTFEALNFSGNIATSFPYCKERKAFLVYLKTKGLLLLKERLIREKREFRVVLAEKKRILEEVNRRAGQ